MFYGRNNSSNNWQIKTRTHLQNQLFSKTDTCEPSSEFSSSFTVSVSLVIRVAIQISRVFRFQCFDGPGRPPWPYTSWGTDCLQTNGEIWISLDSLCNFSYSRFFDCTCTGFCLVVVFGVTIYATTTSSSSAISDHWSKYQFCFYWYRNCIGHSTYLVAPLGRSSGSVDLRSHSAQPDLSQPSQGDTYVAAGWHTQYCQYFQF